jgi:excinuclease UvrABC nuclease subunit
MAPVTFQKFFDLAEEARFHEHRVLMWPRRWKAYRGRKRLRWNTVFFNKKTRTLVPTRPGVYAFFVRPSLANLDVGYLMYIGRTIRSLRTRFGEYLNREKDPYKGRPKIAVLLHQYKGYLYFCSAPIASRKAIPIAEKRLISAFTPPVNDELEAKVGRIVKAF